MQIQEQATPHGPTQARGTPPRKSGRPGPDSAQKIRKRMYSFSDLSGYGWRTRFLIRCADLLFYVVILMFGSTIRWEVRGFEHLDSIHERGLRAIFTFWHPCIFPATWFWRNRGIVVMTSRSFDGEYIARFIQRFGYGAARGSSSRGATGAVVEMVRLMRAGCPTAFTIDGPRGPRYVAKMGAVLLAKKTGNPVLPFTIA